MIRILTLFDMTVLRNRTDTVSLVATQLANTQLRRVSAEPSGCRSETSIGRRVSEGPSGGTKVHDTLLPQVVRIPQVTGVNRSTEDHKMTRPLFTSG